MKFSQFSLLLFSTLSSAQVVNLYSDTNCQNFLETIACGDVWDTCSTRPTPYNSFQFTQASQPCGFQMCVFNWFWMGDVGCGPDNVVGAGCGLDMNCITTYLWPDNGPEIQTPGTMIICEENWD